MLSTLLFGMTITLANVVLPQIRGRAPAEIRRARADLVATAVQRMTGRLSWVGRCRGSAGNTTLASVMVMPNSNVESITASRISHCRARC